jgi:lysophospholipase L1-like esterase
MKHRLVTLVSFLAAVGCATPSPTGPSDPPAGSVVSYSAVGASDAQGVGGSVACIPFSPCPNGTGYVQLVSSRLRDEGKDVTLLNLGIPGGVLSPEIQSIGDALGREGLTNFLTNQVPFVAQDATLVTVFAGGNDANIIGAALLAGYGGSDPEAYLETLTENFGRDLLALAAGIRARAPQARLVVLNLPNLAALPYAAAYTLAERRALQRIAVGLSAEANRLTSAGAIVIDAMCDDALYNPTLYSGDGFHPNDAGYARMADLVYPAASTGAAAAPRSSCSQMTLF